MKNIQPNFLSSAKSQTPEQQIIEACKKVTGETTEGDYQDSLGALFKLAFQQRTYAGSFPKTLKLLNYKDVNVLQLLRDTAVSGRNKDICNAALCLMTELPTPNAIGLLLYIADNTPFDSVQSGALWAATHKLHPDEMGHGILGSLGGITNRTSIASVHYAHPPNEMAGMLALLKERNPEAHDKFVDFLCN